MADEHRASITWSQALAELGLPDAVEVIDSAWVDPDAPKDHDGWRLICRFASPPSIQGNPSSATVRFAVDDAPHERLCPGATLRLYERATGQYAAVSILE